jgi:MoaA/NifB/PqqE/SkfB family radical SAM enzyme
MNLTGLHLLLTYKCTLECDHCFAWGSPWQSGVMSMANIQEVLHQAQELGTITTIYFEGGEPFLYYATLLQGVRESASLAFHTGIVSNGFWATTEEDAMNALSPFAGLIQDLSISSDLFHWDETNLQLARNAIDAANRLGIPVGMLSIARPERAEIPGVSGQLAVGESKVMFRGRAAEKLAGQVPGISWESFTTCPHENFF